MFRKMQAPKLLAVFFAVTVLIQLGSGCWNVLRSSRCCNDIGTGVCFSRSAIFTATPQCPVSYSPTFTLFTRQLGRGSVVFTRNSIPSQFSNTRQTAIIVHGWRDTFSSSRYQTLKDALLARADLNVIGVDWRDGASDLTFVPAAANTQSIGALIGSLVNVLRRRIVTNSRANFWCIGHSLGAHACGFTSLTAQPVLDRITGLDPAGPLFPPNGGLTQNSATNVDVIHTDGVLFGSIVPRGDVDFYPNGGRSQPGCPLSFIPQFRSGDNGNTILSDEERIRLMQNAMTATARSIPILDCSHQRAFVYFLNSVTNPNCYTARQLCSDATDIPGSCADIPATNQAGFMGFRALNGRYSGNLYLKTTLVSPFCTT